MIFLRRRSTELELMDQPERLSRVDIVSVLPGMRRVNRWLGGSAPSIAALTPILRRAKVAEPAAITVCDVGCGGGDVSIAIALAARRQKLPIRVIAVERNATLAAEARRAAARVPEVTVIHADARDVLRAAAAGRLAVPPEASRRGALPAPASPFHAVHCSLMMHHFAAGEVVDWLSLMASAATRGVVVNDLRRHPAAWLAIRAVAPLLCSSDVFRHDAALSVRRAYTTAEWRQMTARAGLRRARVEQRWAWRVVTAWERE